MENTMNDKKLGVKWKHLKEFCLRMRYLFSFSSYLLHANYESGVRADLNRLGWNSIFTGRLISDIMIIILIDFVSKY